VIAVLAVASPALAAPFTVTPRTLSFGKADPGATKTFTVRRGYRPLLSISVSSTGAFSVSPTQALVGPGQPQVFTVTFTSTGIGPESGKISVTGGGTTINVTVRGPDGFPTPTPTISPTPTATPTVIGEPSPTPTLPMITPVPPSASPVSQSGGLLNLFRQIW